MKENSIILEFSLPPTLNKLFSTTKKGKRIKSEEYKGWLKTVFVEYKKQTQYTLTGNEWLWIELNFFLPILNKDWSIKKTDLDNRFKALFDFLWDNLKGFEDSKIKLIKAEKHNSIQNIVKILIYEIN